MVVDSDVVDKNSPCGQFRVHAQRSGTWLQSDFAIRRGGRPASGPAAREDIALTTDVIVGFPGETDEDYEKTRDLVERIQFDNAFVFQYSERRDTPAISCPSMLIDPAPVS